MTAAAESAFAEAVVSQPSFTCPDCGATSHNPNDIEHGYCGRCHSFTEDRRHPRPPGLPAGTGASSSGAGAALSPPQPLGETDRAAHRHTRATR